MRFREKGFRAFGLWMLDWRPEAFKLTCTVELKATSWTGLGRHSSVNLFRTAVSGSGEAHRGFEETPCMLGAERDLDVDNYPCATAWYGSCSAS